MEMKSLFLSSSQNYCPPQFIVTQNITNHPTNNFVKFRKVWAEQDKDEEENEKEEQKKRKQSLFSSVTEALDFSQVRSAEDAVLIEEARDATTKSGKRMNQEQYGALRRKIGSAYKDFFKSYVEVDGEYVEEGWVDKTCKVCKKDTKGEPRQVDSCGRYVHVACVGKSKPDNFFTRLFS